MDQIRLGTIGSGFIVHSMLDNLHRVEGISLEAVYSRSAEKGAALARKYGGEKVYTDMDAFLADENVNTVYIATPNLLHYPQAKQALLAGKNVILEKPFTTKTAHARELVALAKERGLYLVDATPTAYLPNLPILKAQLPKIGRVRLVMANYSQYSSRYDNLKAGELPNIFNPAYGGGCLMDINYYNVYLNAALFGAPVDAEYHPNLHHGAIDTSGVLVMRYGDFVSQATGAKDTWGENFFQIQGEEGYIYVSGGSNVLDEIRVVTRSGEERYNVQQEPNRWYYEVEAISRLLRSGDKAAMEAGLDVMLDTVETIEQARLRAGILFPGD